MIIPAVAITAIVALSTTQGRGEAETASPGVASVPAVQSPAPVASGEAAQDAAAEPAKEAAEEPTEEPAEDPAEEAAEPEAPSMTASQEQAVRKAEQYIDFAAFSRSGLIKQLKYEGFSGGDAKFAVDHIDVDWMEQAALKAEDYLEFTAFPDPVSSSNSSTKASHANRRSTAPRLLVSDPRWTSGLRRSAPVASRSQARPLRGGVEGCVAEVIADRTGSPVVAVNT